ncbi:MAG: hypothetical protein RIS64_4282 [Bacteroidota bacterium]|jgi:hypothetical protein
MAALPKTVLRFMDRLRRKKGQRDEHFKKSFLKCFFVQILFFVFLCKKFVKPNRNK